MQTYTVTEEKAGERLDVYLTECIPELSRSSVKKLCDDDKVLVNDQARPARTRLKMQDNVTVYFDPKDLTEIPLIDLPVLYEDDDCLVIDKPTGVLTHSKGAFNPEGTVASFIRPRVNGLEGERAGIVHRLDRATSGVMICAKTPEALTWLQKQFSSRKVKKTYKAVIHGSLEAPEAVIDAPIARNSRNPKTFMVNTTGKPARTTYHTDLTGSGHSLLRLEPETGRTHQLRVHLAYLKHPIVGDTLYNGEPYTRLLLHAETLEITLPSRERKVFTAPLPPVFTEVCHD